MRIRRAQLAGLRERAARLEIERDQRSRLAAAAERARVAREMHDIVGHNLSVIITLADGGAYAADVDPERGKEACSSSATPAAGPGRAAAHARRPARATTDPPRPSSARSPASRTSTRCASGSAPPAREVVYRTGGELDALDRGVQLTAYRIVQEALTNTLKHAGRRHTGDTGS